MKDFFSNFKYYLFQKNDGSEKSSSGRSANKAKKRTGLDENPMDWDKTERKNYHRNIRLAARR